MENGLGKQKKTNLLVYEISPETSLSPLIRIGRQQWSLVRPYLINVLNYYQGLTNRLTIMNQHWYLLV
jgi:hypothetical protein